MISIRKAELEDAKGIARVQVETWRTAYKGIVPDTYLKSMSISAQAKRSAEGMKTEKQEDRRVFQYVAQNEKSEIIGFVVGGDNRYKEQFPHYEGELYAIYILEAYQGTKTGTKLVRHLIDQLLQHDISNMLVWVLADNHAKHFYQKLGAVYLDRKTLSIAGKELEEYVYAWESIAD